MFCSRTRTKTQEVGVLFKERNSMHQNEYIYNSPINYKYYAVFYCTISSTLRKIHLLPRVTGKLLLGDYAECIGFLHALNISENLFQFEKHSFSLHTKLTKNILKSENKKIRFFAITAVFPKQQLTIYLSIEETNGVDCEGCCCIEG